MKKLLFLVSAVCLIAAPAFAQGQAKATPLKGQVVTATAKQLPTAQLAVVDKADKDKADRDDSKGDKDDGKRDCKEADALMNYFDKAAIASGVKFDIRALETSQEFKVGNGKCSVAPDDFNQFGKDDHISFTNPTALITALRAERDLAALTKKFAEFQTKALEQLAIFEKRVTDLETANAKCGCAADVKSLVCQLSASKSKGGAAPQQALYQAAATPSFDTAAPVVQSFSLNPGPNAGMTATASPIADACGVLEPYPVPAPVGGGSGVGTIPLPAPSPSLVPAPPAAAPAASAPAAPTAAPAAYY